MIVIDILETQSVDRIIILDSDVIRECLLVVKVFWGVHCDVVFTDSEGYHSRVACWTVVCFNTNGSNVPMVSSNNTERDNFVPLHSIVSLYADVSNHKFVWNRDYHWWMGVRERSAAICVEQLPSCPCSTSSTIIYGINRSLEGPTLSSHQREVSIIVIATTTIIMDGKS